MKPFSQARAFRVKPTGIKGQILSTDAIAALAIFAVIVGVVLSIQNSVENRILGIENFRETRDTLVEVSDQLVSTRGNPEHWHTNNTQIQSIGLIYKDRVLMEEKVLFLSNMTYTDAKRAMGFKGRNEFFIELLERSGSNCTVRATPLLIGSRPSNERESLSIDRFVMIEGRDCRLRLWVWRD